MLDQMIQKKLFREANGPRETQAAAEGLRAKKCLGALRYLWRNARTAAHHPFVAAMKNLLEDSPLQEARRAHHEPEPESPEQVSSDHEDSESGGAASDDGGDEGAAEESESEVEPEEEAPVPTSQDSSESVNSEAGAGSNHGGDDDDDANDGGASEHSVLPREPDSQREGAWIGSFYQENSSEGRSPDMPPRNVRSKAERPQQLYDSWVTDIMRNLRDDHGLDEPPGLVFEGKLSMFCLFSKCPKEKKCLCKWIEPPQPRTPQEKHTVGSDALLNLRHPMIEEYKKHCIRALGLYGNHVFATLCSARHFNEWLHEQKGQDTNDPSLFLRAYCMNLRLGIKQVCILRLYKNGGNGDTNKRVIKWEMWRYQKEGYRKK